MLLSYLLLAGECELVVRVGTENALTRRVEEEERFLLASSVNVSLWETTAGDQSADDEAEREQYRSAEQ